MREVKSLAQGMKEAIANVKKANLDAKSELDGEIQRSLTNADKVRSFTRDLKDANGEVESFLGDTGSNFPQEGGSDTPSQNTSHRADANGVILNTEINK